MNRKTRRAAVRDFMKAQLRLRVATAAHFRKAGRLEDMQTQLIAANDLREKIALHDSLLRRLVATNWFHRAITLVVWVFIVAVVRIVWTLAN